MGVMHVSCLRDPVVAADRKRRQKKAPEQVPTNTTTQNAYGTH